MFLIWAVIGALIGVLAAQRRGFSPVVGIFGGMLLGGFAFLMFFTSDRRRKCAYCAEAIQPEATVCKHCGANLAAFSKSA